MEFIDTFLEALSYFVSNMSGIEITLIYLGILFFIANSILNYKNRENKNKNFNDTVIDNRHVSNTSDLESDTIETNPSDYSRNIVTSDFDLSSCTKDSLNDANAKGSFLEYLVINDLLHNYPDSKILRNLILPKPKGGTSEIDILVLNPKGIICIECKNYNAKISGSYKDKYWKAEYSESYIVDFYSPVLQNLNHIKTLDSLNLDFKVHNIVVFCDNADLSDEVFKNKSVVKLKYLNKKLDYLFNISDYVISQNKLNDLYNYILKSQTVGMLDHLSYVESFNVCSSGNCAG